jgi:hypothetical protein
MHMTATLSKWYEENGRHEIIVGKNVNLTSKDHTLVLKIKDVNWRDQRPCAKAPGLLRAILAIAARDAIKQIEIGRILKQQDYDEQVHSFL